MLYELMLPLSDGGDFFNLFRYITFRTGGALLTALIFSFVFGRPIIEMLKKRQPSGQPIRDDGPERHIIEKAGTPTMGGLLILFSLAFSTFLWARFDSLFVWMVLFICLSFGVLGAVDDYRKLRSGGAHGLPARWRLLYGFIISALIAYCINYLTPPSWQGMLALPIFKNLVIDMGILFVPFASIVIVSTANAVNLTDGLDGLAIVPVIIAAAAYGFMAYFSGNVVFAEYLNLPYISGTGEIAIFCGGLIGAGLGFLWFNAPPAKVFMGDTGSLSLGGSIGAIAVATKHELLLLVIGGLFVLEAVSVIVQVVSFKLTGRRVFKMAPIHHHYEKLGLHESTIVIRFWIIALILALLGLATLKLR